MTTERKKSSLEILAEQLNEADKLARQQQGQQAWVDYVAQLEQQINQTRGTDYETDYWREQPSAQMQTQPQIIPEQWLGLLEKEGRGGPTGLATGDWRQGLEALGYPGVIGGAAVSAPFRERTQEFETARDPMGAASLFLPGAPEAEKFKEWESPLQIPVGIPSWKQWGGWLGWGEKPDTFEMARLGGKELAEEVGYLPLWLIGGKGGLTIFQKAAKIEAKQAAGKTLKEAEKKILEQAMKAEAQVSKAYQFAELQPAEKVAELVSKPDLSREIANLPGLKQVMAHVNPASVANTPAERAVVIRAIIRDEGQQKAMGLISYLNELGAQGKVFGKLDKEGLLGGKLQGLHLNDIRTYPKRYWSKLTEQQRLWVTRAGELERAKLDFLTKNGININELAFEEGGVYAGRRVFGKSTAEGQMLIANVGAGPGRPGAKMVAEKTRVFKTAEEAAKEGYRYLPEDEALALNIQGAYNRVADKQMADWILNKVPWRTTGAPEELKLAAEAARTKLLKSRQLSAALNRAVRGERVPDVTINSIAAAYPNHANALKRLIVKLQAKAPRTAREVQKLDKEAKEFIKSNQIESLTATNARARARERAMQVKLGEARVEAPAFAQKILTGPEAKATADVLRKAFSPEFNKALDAVNKVNAIGRFFALAGDVSPFSIQLLFMAGYKPRQYAKAIEGFARAFFDPKFHASYLTKNKAIIDASPNLILTRGGGTEFTEAMAKGGLLRQQPFKMGGKILEPFQRGFESAIDVAGIELKKALQYKARTPDEIAQLDNFVNEFRGVASSAKLGVAPKWRAWETIAMLAPRYNRAIAALLYDLWRGNLRGDLAREAMAKGVAGVSAMAVAASLAMGENFEEMVEHFNPNSSRFMTWKIGGQNIGPGSKVRSLIKLWAQSAKNPDDVLKLSMDNPMLRFMRGNLSPVISTSLDLITGKDYIGDPSRDSMLSFSKTVLAENLTPIWLANVLYEGGTIGERAIRGASEFAGGRAYPETDWEKLDRLRKIYMDKEGYNQEWGELPDLYRGELTRKYPDLKKMQEEYEKRRAEMGTDIEKVYYNLRNAAKQKRNTELNDAARLVQQGVISKKDYDDIRGYTKPYYSGAMSALYEAKAQLAPEDVAELEKWIDESQHYWDKVTDSYNEYRNQMIEQSGTPINWDMIDSGSEQYLAQFPDDIHQYVLAKKNEWIQDLPEPARTVEEQRAAGIEAGVWFNRYRETAATKEEALAKIKMRAWIEEQKVKGGR